MRSTMRRRCGLLVVVGAASAMLLAGGCNAIHGLGSDLQYLSDSVRGVVYVDDPARD